MAMMIREFYSTISTLDNISPALRDKASELLKQHDMKLMNAASAKKKKNAESNAPLVAKILATLSEVTPMLTSDIAVACGISTPKASALLRQLEADGEIDSRDVKVPKVGNRKAYCLVGKENQLDGFSPYEITDMLN